MKFVRLATLLLACLQAGGCASVATAPAGPQAARAERTRQLPAAQEAPAASQLPAVPESPVVPDAAQQAPRAVQPRRAVPQLPATPPPLQSQRPPTLPQAPAPVLPKPAAPSGSPVPMTSCDPGGCWDANANRYNGGAGGTYLNNSGKLCQRQGVWMQCF